MNTVILLNRTQTILTDIYTEYPAGMLPLLDKPAISFMLDRLQRQGITKITLAVSNATIKTVSAFGDGSTLGLELSYLNTDRDDDLRWFRDTRKGVFKILDGNIAIEKAPENVVTGKPLFPALDDNLDSSVIYIHNVGYALQVIRSGSTRIFISPDPGAQLSRYHARSHSVLRQNFQELSPPFTTRCPTEHSIINIGTSLNPGAILGDFVYIGKFCAVHRDCQIRDDVVIGAGSTIDRHVVLNNTVILPNTDVPAHRDLSHCLVSTDWIYSLVDKNFKLLNGPRLIARTA